MEGNFGTCGRAEDGNFDPTCMGDVDSVCASLCRYWAPNQGGSMQLRRQFSLFCSERGDV
jgi:hypothetical protein